MKILFIENDKNKTPIKQRVSFFYITLSDEILSKPIEEIAKEIHEKHSDTKLFIINANVLVPSRNRTDFAGIELLKLIRLYGMNQHVILYSFMSREQIMEQSVKHSIIFSKGVSFYRLPEFINVVESPKFCKEIEEKAKNKALNDLSEYFKAEYQLPDNRHFMANWWGLLQLWNVDVIFKKIDREEIPAMRKKIIDEEFLIYKEEILSLQGLIMQYIYTHRKNTNINRELYHKLGSQYIQTMDELKYFNPKEKKEKQPPKILYVDDQAENGWAYIFKEMIYWKDKQKKRLLTLPSEIYSKTADEIYKKIIETIDAEVPDILILDLRLTPNDEILTNRRELTGLTILKKLQDSLIPCPIMIVSASNKSITFKHVVSYGAHAFWIKEGADDTLSGPQSVENYVNFLKIINQLQTSSFKIYTENIKCIKSIKDNKDNWWKNQFWDEKSKYNANKEILIEKNLVSKGEVLEIFKNLMNLYGRFLAIKIFLDHNETEDYSSQEKTEAGKLIENMLDLLVVESFKIVETIIYIKNRKNDKNKDEYSVHEKSSMLFGETFFHAIIAPLASIRASKAHTFKEVDKQAKKVLTQLNSCKTRYKNDDYFEDDNEQMRNMENYFRHLREFLKDLPSRQKGKVMDKKTKGEKVKLHIKYKDKNIWSDYNVDASLNINDQVDFWYINMYNKASDVRKI